jgi:hypothetical protein
MGTHGGEVNRANRYQSREATVGIVIAVDGKDHKDNAEGNKAAETALTIATVQQEIENALLMWQKPVGFDLEDLPYFLDSRPIGADQATVWWSIQYVIPDRHYSVGYGGSSAIRMAAFQVKYPNFGPEFVSDLIIGYKAKGDFPGRDWGKLWTSIPFPPVFPADAPEVAVAVAASMERDTVYHITDENRASMEERGTDAAAELERTHSGPYKPPAP